MTAHDAMPLPEDAHPEHRLKLESIRRAMEVIDPVFLHSPQYDCEALSQALGCPLTIKLETANPIRSFKGRGATFLIRERLARGEIDGRRLVGASAGNWGQALAYACRSHGLPLILYAATSANPLKVERMRGFGAEVRLAGDDFDAAKQEAEAYAMESGGMMLADGLDPEASEGAGTIALELMAGPTPPDCIVVPLGNGAMLTGIARWAKAVHPAIEIIGVQAAGADAMEKSWRSGKLVFPETVSTIADGIGVRVPIAEAVEDMNGLVDDVHLVEEAALVEAMKLFHAKAGLVAEPSGAAGLAAILSRPEHFRGRRVATILCGGNLTGEQMRTWLG
ncbi:MAG: pyridoxal-phosphate dependent enzyme [Hoeflea sp.]|uniref:threonine ammonia-lyase n=1 Tax=Hoeflea sp. TaxID=1940281 RepID=UPI00272F06A7|nr:pyridoxal-phosphate dependent enzyme [Hoeflea sp.]MDP2118376.1 pyridoxal-phosphate dependent enzyme [Hoeflea sp.]